MIVYDDVFVPGGNCRLWHFLRITGSLSYDRCVQNLHLSLVSNGPLSSLGTGAGENAQIATKMLTQENQCTTNQPCIHAQFFKDQISSDVLALSK